MKKTLLLSVVVAGLLFSGCDKAKEAADKAGEATKEVASSATAATTEAVSKATEAVKESATKAVEKTVETTKEVAQKAVDSAKESANAAVEKAKEGAAKAVESTKEAASAAVEKAKEAVSAPKVDGKAIFTACAGCHGQKGEKKALQVSQVIGGWDAAKVEEALKGYKAGTYGGNMKGVMQGQAQKLDDAKIKAVAEYISTLK